MPGEAALHPEVERAIRRAVADATRVRTVEARPVPDDDDAAKLAARLRWLQTSLGLAVAVITAGGAAAGWVWLQGAASAEAQAHEARQDADIAETGRVLREHVREAEAAQAAQARQLRAIGALQVVQGDEQRRILLRSLPAAGRDALQDKPQVLLDAERAVLQVVAE